MKERDGAGKSPDQELKNLKNNHLKEQSVEPHKVGEANTPLAPLLTETLKKQIPALYSQENEKDPLLDRVVR